MIAQTIAQQLGSLALALLGAHMFVDLKDGLQFRIRGCNKINLIQIILDPCDTYTVKFWVVQTARKQLNQEVSYTQMEWRQVASLSDVYCDMLHQIIEEQTGLYTQL